MLKRAKRFTTDSWHHYPQNMILYNIQEIMMDAVRNKTLSDGDRNYLVLHLPRVTTKTEFTEYTQNIKTADDFYDFMNCLQGNIDIDETVEVLDSL